MKKYIKILIVLLLFFSFPIVSYAETEEKINCNDVIKNYDEFISAEKEIKGLDCGGAVNDLDVATKCNEYGTKYSLYLAKIFQYNESKPDCTTPKIQTVIDKHEEDCGSVYSSELKGIKDSVMTLFYVIAPFLLILFGSVDFAKVVVAADPSIIKKSRSDFIKRLIAFVLLYMSPALVNLILQFNVSGFDLKGNAYSCKSVGYTYYQRELSTTYEPETTQSSGASLPVLSGNIRYKIKSPGVIDIKGFTGDIGNWHTDWFQCDKRWGSITYGSGSTVCRGACGAFATSIVAAHYGGDDENSPYYPLNVINEYVSRNKITYNSIGYIASYFNEWHQELGVKATIVKGHIDPNRLDEVLSNGGALIALLLGDIKYNGVNVWTGQGHYVTFFAGNQYTGYRVSDSNGGHNNGSYGVREWAPYNQHLFPKEYVLGTAYHIYIEKK